MIDSIHSKYKERRIDAVPLEYVEDLPREHRVGSIIEGQIKRPVLGA